MTVLFFLIVIVIFWMEWWPTVTDANISVTVSISITKPVAKLVSHNYTSPSPLHDVIYEWPLTSLVLSNVILDIVTSTNLFQITFLLNQTVSKTTFTISFIRTGLFFHRYIWCKKNCLFKRCSLVTFFQFFTVKSWSIKLY